MTYPRLGTASGTRAMASAQRAYDNMEEDCDETPTLYACECADHKCTGCGHEYKHEHSESCKSGYCHSKGEDVECVEV